MNQTICGLLADHYLAERAKFKSPLVLVHGLWTASWCWQAWATHFCNLGWDCWAVNFRDRFASADDRPLQDLSLARFAEDLVRVASSFSFPPVVLAHGLGALVALKAAEGTNISALVLASPSPPKNLEITKSRALRLLRLKYLPLMLLRRPFRLEEKDLRKTLLVPLPGSVQNEISRRIVPESSQLAAEFFHSRVHIDQSLVRCPRLVLAGSEDQIIPPTFSRELAQWLGADYKEYRDQGYWIIEVNGEAIVRDIHRWLIHELSDSVLLTEST